jgi:hypothetical protein
MGATDTWCAPFGIAHQAQSYLSLWLRPGRQE